MRRFAGMTVFGAMLFAAGSAGAQSKPDLAITSVEPVPGTACKPGAPVWSFKATVHNRGAAVAPSVPLNEFLKVSDTHPNAAWESTDVEIAGVTGANAPFIPAGAARVVTVSINFNDADPEHMWEFPSHPLKFTVDPAGRVDESMEMNNHFQGVLPPLAACRPDLTVSAARFVQSPDGDYALVTIRNQGARPVTRATVGLVNEKSPGGPVWRETWSGTLKTGQTAEIRVTGSLREDLDAREPGEKPRPQRGWTDFSCITAVADPQKQISETNESNNEMKCIPVKRGT